MAIWLVTYWSRVNRDLDPAEVGQEIHCFRVFPEGEPERWIAQTNPDLPREAQEECALLIAEALSEILGK
jgi:hypothetical protein